MTEHRGSFPCLETKLVGPCVCSVYAGLSLVVCLHLQLSTIHQSVRVRLFVSFVGSPVAIVLNAFCVLSVICDGFSCLQSVYTQQSSGDVYFKSDHAHTHGHVKRMLF